MNKKIIICAPEYLQSLFMVLASLAGIPFQQKIMVTNTGAYVLVTFAYLLFGIATWYMFTML